MQENMKKDDIKRKRKEISKTRKIISYILFIIIVVPLLIVGILYKIDDYKMKNKSVPKTVFVDGHKISIYDTYSDIESSDFYIFNSRGSKIEPKKNSSIELRTKDDNVYIELWFHNFDNEEKEMKDCPIYSIEVEMSKSIIDSDEHSIRIADGVKLGENFYHADLSTKYDYNGIYCHDSEGSEYWYYKDKHGNELHYDIDNNKIYCVNIRMNIEK